MRWYRETSASEARRFGEVRGGLNQMTIGRFERIIAQSDFEFEKLEAVPIRKLRPIANKLTEGIHDVGGAMQAGAATNVEWIVVTQAVSLRPTLNGGPSLFKNNFFCYK